MQPVIVIYGISNKETNPTLPLLEKKAAQILTQLTSDKQEDESL